MERRRNYSDKKVKEDLYQYEMGIELGADIEAEKERHRKEYDREKTVRDKKGQNNDLLQPKK